MTSDVEWVSAARALEARARERLAQMADAVATGHDPEPARDLGNDARALDAAVWDAIESRQP